VAWSQSVHLEPPPVRNRPTAPALAGTLAD